MRVRVEGTEQEINNFINQLAYRGFKILNKSKFYENNRLRGALSRSLRGNSEGRLFYLISILFYT